MGYTTKNQVNMSEPKETTPLDAMVAGLNKLYDAMENPPQNGRTCDCEDAPCCGCYSTPEKENKWIH